MKIRYIMAYECMLNIYCKYKTSLTKKERNKKLE